MRRIVLTGGGSGGHLYPLIALWQEGKRRYPDARFFYVGSRFGIEARVCLPKTWETCLVPVRGIRGQRGLRGISRWMAIVRSLGIVYGRFRRWRPDMVISTGGYAGAIAPLVARWWRVPVFLHEQNVVPGWTTRIVAQWARGLALTYPVKTSVPCPTAQTGNPVRREFFEIPWDRPPWPPMRVLVLGGSQGSRYLNHTVPEALAQLQQTRDIPVQVLHQVGRLTWASVVEHYRTAGIDARVVDYIERVWEAFAWAHVVISRAGSTTLAEIAAARVAAILVPLEGVAGDHQRINAEYWVRQGAALLARQTESVQRLVNCLALLYNRPEQWQQLRHRASALATPQAATNFWAWVESLNRKPLD